MEGALAETPLGASAGTDYPVLMWQVAANALRRCKMGAMNDFERTIVKHFSDAPDAVATCPAGHEMHECQIEQWDDSVDRWWVAAPVGTEYRGWTNESSMWEEFAEAGVYVWDYCEQTDRYVWIVPSTRTPYQGEVRGPC